MKKLLPLILSLLLLVPALTSCSSDYENAVKALSDDVLTADGTYTMSEDLVTALETAEFTEPKNIIFMIGDGMGQNQLTSAQAVYSESLYDGRMAWTYLPMSSVQATSSASAAVTDSAAGGTALSTGFRTANDVIGMDAFAITSYKTILELAAEKGKSTGIIATKSVTDATPASFTAHVPTRSSESVIAEQQAAKVVDGSLDLILGGGSTFYESAPKKALTDAGVTYTDSFAEASAASLPLVGLFAEGVLDTTDPNTPTLAEMTDIALKKLSEDKNGFFIMIEGSQIDSFGHASDIDGQTYETYQFDCAIAVALRFAAMNPDTVIIVTADHETGGLVLPENPEKSNVSEFKYTSNGNHTQTAVPVLAIGHGVEALEGINHNTDCARFVASLLGEEAFGQEKTVHTLVDSTLTVKSGESVTVGKADFGVDPASFEGVLRTVVLNVKNTDSEAIRPPELKFLSPDSEATDFFPAETEVYAGEPYIWLAPGETRQVSYSPDVNYWNTESFRKLEELVISGDGCEITEILVTERPLWK